MKISRLFLHAVFLIYFGLSFNEVQAFVGVTAKAAISPLSKKVVVLADDEIERLAQMIKGSGDASKVKVIIGSKNLPPEVIEDTYARIAIHRGNISRAEAESMFKNLHGVEGFSGTMSKIVGVNPAGSRGHLNELRIANAAAERGFKVEGIGVKYSDGIKKSPTDMDIIISKSGHKFPIEAKDYDDITFDSLSNTMRPDMDSLVAFKKMSSMPGMVHPVFTVTNLPRNPDVVILMQKEADKRGIELIYGSPEQQLIQLEQLFRIVN